MHHFSVNGDVRRWLYLAAAATSLVFLANCGGGGGDGVAPPPATGAPLSGTVAVPIGTPSIPDAEVSVRLAFPPNTLITKSTLRSDGRYALTIPTEFVGRDLLITVEKTVDGQRVRLATLLLSFPARGYAGANLDAHTTLATEEILRYAREQNLTALSPNGVAVVVDRVRDALKDRPSPRLVVGQTLPENLGDGLLDEEIRNLVRPRVQEQAENLRPPTGDVAVAKSMTQMLRDYSTAWTDRGGEEEVDLENDVRRQQEAIENEIVQPLEALGDRGMSVTFRALGLERDRNDTHEGFPPGRYRETLSFGRYRLERIGNAPDNRTWIVESGPLTCTVTTANPLNSFELSPEAGRVSFSVRKQGDPRLRYDGAVEVTQRDPNGNPTQLRVQITLTDGELREPIRFNGTANTTPRPDGSFRALSFSGTFQSQYADLTVTNLTHDTYPDSERVKQLSAGRVQAALEVEYAPNLDLQNLLVTFRDADPPDENIQQISLQSLISSAARRRLVMRDVQMQFQAVGGEQTMRPVRLQAYVEYNTPDDETLIGQVNARWENPVAYDPFEAEFLPLNQFPRGNFEFNGTLTPRVGRRALVYFNIVPEPIITPPRVRTALRIEFGEERIQGEFVGNLRVQNGQVERRRMFENTTLQMTHTPSNFRLELSYNSATDTVSGVIKKPDGTVVAQIGRASALGLPDLGNAYIVRYSDNTFETINSLLRLGD